MQLRWWSRMLPTPTAVVPGQVVESRAEGAIDEEAVEHVAHAVAPVAEERGEVRRDHLLQQLRVSRRGRTHLQAVVAVEEVVVLVEEDERLQQHLRVRALQQLLEHVVQVAVVGP